MLAGYGLHGTDSEQEESDDTSESEQTEEDRFMQLSKVQEKFERLKKKRKFLSSETHAKADLTALSKDISECTKEQGKRKRERKTRNADVEELKNSMSHAYILKDDHDPYNLKKSKLEDDIDDAIKNKNFSEAEKLSDRLVQQSFTSDVQYALHAKQFLQKKKEKEEQKKKRKKLSWTFNHKQRWETKGNM